MNNISVPFTIKNVFQGFAESQGILRLNEDTLSIEFQTQDSIVGAIKSDVKNIELPISDIQELDFKKSIFGSTLSIRLSNFSEASKVPKQEPGEIKVTIKKKNIEAALSFVSYVRYWK